jgi:hypothetical protein
LIIIICEQQIPIKLSIYLFSPGHTPIASICRLPAEVLADLCDNNKQPEGAKKLTLITCRFGKKEGLSSTSKNGLIWTISKDTLPSRAKMKTYIEKTIK